MTQVNTIQTLQNKILLVEDNPIHLRDARAMLEKRLLHKSIEGYDFATNLTDAQKLLHVNHYQGVLTDVFFPRKEGELEEQFGTTIGEYAIANKVPYILITSTAHHGEKTQPVCSWARNHGIEIVDAQLKGGFEGEASEKNWRGAYIALSYLIALNNGEVKISEEKMPFTNVPKQLNDVFRLISFFSPNSRHWMDEGYFTRMKDFIPGMQYVLDKYGKGILKE